ncbi:MAG TPA: ribosome biogenesis protein [Candidatus Nitrosocosmicus sp.]|nr:ribosome biogenesis protein [Candidatus Nitrosocosmicus sp.]HYX56380.1 ribosome biogenesis protein [Nitrososphaeraceae archaeon]
MVTSISLIIAEASLETVPKQIASHPAVKNQAQKLGRTPREILLDKSYHHAAMLRGGLDSYWKRGRPDIIHFALMEALSTPLFVKNMLKVYIHTVKNKLIVIGDNLRIPKSYFRFEGIMINLFREKVIKSADDNNILLELHDNITFEQFIINRIRPDKLIGLSSDGVKSSAEEIASKNITKNNDHIAFVVGGFPKGQFSNDTSKIFSCSYSIGELKLEAHIVIARILYECEKVLDLHHY